MLIVLGRSVIARFEESVARKRAVLSVLVEVLNRPEVTRSRRIVQPRHHQPGERKEPARVGQRKARVRLAVGLLRGAGIHLPRHGATLRIDLIVNGLRVTHRRRMVVHLTTGRGRVDEGAVGERLAGYGTMPVIADRELPGQRRQHRHLRPRVEARHDVPRIVDRSAEHPVGAVDNGIHVVVDEPHVRRLGGVIARDFVVLKELVVRISEALARVGMGLREIGRRIRNGRDVLRSLDGRTVLLHVDLLDHGDPIGIEAVQGIPEIAVESLEMLSARRGLLVVQPAQQIVERPVLEHEHENVLDLLQAFGIGLQALRRHGPSISRIALLREL